MFTYLAREKKKGEVARQKSLQETAKWRI